MTPQRRVRVVAVGRLIAAGLFAAALSTACTSGAGGSGSSDSPTTSASSPATATVTTTVASQSSTPSSGSAGATTAPSPTGSTVPTESVTRTERRVLEPVNADGTPSFPVRAGQGSITCSEVAESSLSDNVYDCSPEAADAHACWVAATPGRMLCLTDPWASSAVTSYPVSGRPAPVKHLTTPVPLGLVLGDAHRATCKHGNGGAGARQTQHPDWVPYYFCSDDRLVWGPSGGHGFTVANGVYHVYVGRADQPLTALPVRTAAFVTTKG